MRLPFLILLLIAVLFGSGYWYETFDTSCRVPVKYRIGAVDSRFGTSVEELKRIALRGETLWEEKLGRDIFVYDEDAILPINLVFDERQEKADIERELREDLEAKEGMSESVSMQYDRLISEFRKLKKQYESDVVLYERKLSAYNKVVTDWNSKGGAPESVMSELRDEEASLRSEERSLEGMAKKLNTLVSDLNQIGARGNELIEDYNDIVEAYNSTVETEGEFTQGDYTGEAINIYQFNSEDELVIVLAHEFGHALQIDHIENEESIMYYHMGAQSIENGLSFEDMSAFKQACTEQGLLKTMLRFVGSLV